MQRRTPVTLLTGFLGAGKTTILNKLLKDPSSGQIAVIVNEFGDAGLDHDLIEESAEDIILMEAGCICCSIRGDLSNTLRSLEERRSDGQLNFDRVVIETTGLADPGPVHHTLLMEPSLAMDFSLDGIVTAVDSVLGLTTLGQHAEAQAQVAMADAIILTKTDLVTPTDQRLLENKLSQLNPRAKRLEAKHGTVPVAELFGLCGLETISSHEQTMNWLTPANNQPADDPLAGLSGFGDVKATPKMEFTGQSHHATDNRITTASVTIDTPIQASVFDFWLDTLIALKGPHILRLKGLVHIEDVPQPHVFHGVQHIFDPPVPLREWPEGDTTSRVVVIAKDMSQDDLDQSLAILKTRQDADVMANGITVHALASDPA